MVELYILDFKWAAEGVHNQKERKEETQRQRDKLQL